ncbi:MAG: NAD(P)-dependent oxidoreductase [Bacteroidetes bacterium]|nr:NAD(P)-dependent oxidoreductase [Bacteroidota bacterium]
MKFLIIGGRSSVARMLKPSLGLLGDVVIAGRRGCDLKLDLADPIESIEFPKGIDVVVHTAAHFGGKEYVDIFDAENINVLGALKMCRLSISSGVRHFIYVSTIFSKLDSNASNFSIYALSKRHAEEIIQYYCSLHGLSLTILRPSHIYGNDHYFSKHQPFFYSIIDKAQQGQDIFFYGSHDPLRNYIHIDDFVTIITKVIQTQTIGSYNCAYTEDVTYSQIAEAANEVFNSKGSIVFLPDKPDILDYAYEKENSLYEKLNFYPQISIFEGIRKLAKYRKYR